MTIKKATEHFGFKLNPKNNIWKATKKDIEALNTIMDFVEAKHKKQIQDYHLFAKLYIMVYSQFLDKYKSTVFDDIPKKQLNKYLETPLVEIIERFKDKLNESELYTVFDLNGRKDFEHMHITHIESFYKDMGYEGSVLESKVSSITEERKKSNKALRTLLSDYPEIEGYLYKGNEIWDYDTVKDNLEAQINNTIDSIQT